jgi:hypothetical protein
MLCCRLTDDMLHPNNFQKMNVRLAARLLSNTNALGFHVYRNMPAKSPSESLIKAKFAGSDLHIRNNH